MVRRVKAYLKNMRIITDEERLHQMSLECEAPAGGIPPPPPPQQQTVNTNSPASPNTNQPQSVSYLKISTWTKIIVHDLNHPRLSKFSCNLSASQEEPQPYPLCSEQRLLRPSVSGLRGWGWPWGQPQTAGGCRDSCPSPHCQSPCQQIWGS